MQASSWHNDYFYKTARSIKITHCLVAVVGPLVSHIWALIPAKNGGLTHLPPPPLVVWSEWRRGGGDFEETLLLLLLLLVMSLLLWMSFAAVLSSFLLPFVLYLRHWLWSWWWWFIDPGLAFGRWFGGRFLRWSPLVWLCCVRDLHRRLGMTFLIAKGVPKKLCEHFGPKLPSEEPMQVKCSLDVEWELAHFFSNIVYEIWWLSTWLDLRVAVSRDYPQQRNDAFHLGK